MKYFFIILLTLKLTFTHVLADVINNIEVKNQLDRAAQRQANLFKARTSKLNIR